MQIIYISLPIYLSLSLSLSHPLFPISLPRYLHSSREIKFKFIMRQLNIIWNIPKYHIWGTNTYITPGQFSCQSCMWEKLWNEMRFALTTRTTTLSMDWMDEARLHVGKSHVKWRTENEIEIEMEIEIKSNNWTLCSIGPSTMKLCVWNFLHFVCYRHLW